MPLCVCSHKADDHEFKAARLKGFCRKWYHSNCTCTKYQPDEKTLPPVSKIIGKALYKNRN